MFKLFICLVFACIGSYTNAQMSYPDSLIELINKEESDVERARLFSDISGYYKTRNTDSAFYLAEQAVHFARLAEDDIQMANALNSLGNAYNAQGKYSLALQVFMDALVYSNRSNDDNRTARINNNIGIIYYNQQDYEKALDHFQTTANLLIADGDTSGAIVAFNNIGGIYASLEKHEESLAYFTRGYNLCLETENEYFAAVLLSGIATVHATTNEEDLALEENFEALKIKRKYGNKGSIVYSLEAISDIYIAKEDYRSAIPYLEEMLVMAQETRLQNLEVKANDKLSTCFYNLGNYAQAYDYLYENQRLQHEMDSVAQTIELADIQHKYEKAQDQKKIETLEKNELIRQAEIDRKENQNLMLIGGGLLILLIAFLIYGRLRTSRKQNQIIQEQKHLVDLRNKEVMDSITYAQRIQQAMLTEEDREGVDLPEHFIFFKPKDIVSGDFYWFIRKPNHFYVAAVDCTGHGVPGAFLTLLGTAFLNEIVSRDENIEPAEILNQLRERIIFELGKNEDGDFAKDGMDMSLIRVNKSDLSATWAGANNPLWIVRKGSSEVEEIKADKQPVGYYFKQSPFTNHKVQFQSGDQFYLFSDGYPDQFGIDIDGKQKKYKTRRFKEKVGAISSQKPDEQMDSLIREFESWKGELEQLDDVCIIGMRL